jgi:hypothetical protein
VSDEAAVQAGETVWIGCERELQSALPLLNRPGTRPCLRPGRFVVRGGSPPPTVEPLPQTCHGLAIRVPHPTGCRLPIWVAYISVALLLGLAGCSRSSNPTVAHRHSYSYMADVPPSPWRAGVGHPEEMCVPIDLHGNDRFGVNQHAPQDNQAVAPDLLGVKAGPAHADAQYRDACRSLVSDNVSSGGWYLSGG